MPEPAARPAGTDARLQRAAHDLYASYERGELATAGCRSEVVLQLGLGVLERWRHPTPPAHAAIPPRRAWADEIDHIGALVVPMWLASNGNPRAEASASAARRRYGARVEDVLERVLSADEPVV